jgi:MFS family permease
MRACAWVRTAMGGSRRDGTFILGIDRQNTDNSADRVAVELATGTPDEETTVLQLPRIASALGHRDFRLFWAGNFLSNVGTWMQNIAQGWLVLKLTNSAFWLGMVGFASAIPILFFALIGGVIADHVNNRKLLLATQSAMMVFAFAMAGLTWWNKIDVWGITLLALGTGIAMSLNTPSYQALVPRLVPREDLTNAIALNSAQFNMSRVIGPTLGGFAMHLVGIAGNFFLNGLSFLAVLFALTQMRIPERTGPGEGHFWGKMKQGFAYVFRHPYMGPLVVLVAIGSLGLLMACSGTGAFFGAITIAYVGGIRRRGQFVIRSGSGFFSSIILFTFSRNFLLSGFALMAAGYCMIIMVATVNALLQHLAEDPMRGRVMSIYSTAFLGLPPIGSLIAGLLARAISPAHALAGMSAVALAGSLVVFGKSRELRALD